MGRTASMITHSELPKAKFLNAGNAQEYRVWPVQAMKNVWQSRYLTWQMTHREVQGRYRGTWIGLGWSLLMPLVMLCIYVFIFTQVFLPRWPVGQQQASVFTFVIILFSGLSLFGFIQETLTRAPMLVTNQQSFVKKIMFPLDILSWVSIGAALAHFSWRWLSWSQLCY